MNILHKKLNEGSLSDDQLLLISQLNEKKVNELGDKLDAEIPDGEFTEKDRKRILSKVITTISNKSHE